MSIIEKLGITPIESHSITGPMNLKYEVSHTKEVRKLEQQRNEMFVALIKVQLHTESIYNTELSETYYKNIIEKADPQHRSWSEIKELI